MAKRALWLGIFLCLGPAMILVAMILGSGLFWHGATTIDPLRDPYLQWVQAMAKFGTFAMPVGMALIVLACVRRSD